MIARRPIGHQTLSDWNDLMQVITIHTFVKRVDDGYFSNENIHEYIHLFLNLRGAILNAKLICII